MSQYAYDLATSQTFWQSRDALDHPQRVALADAMDKVQRGLPSARVHKLDPMPFVSFGVNRDALRVICQREERTLLLLWVAAHDAAYEWARRHRVRQVGSFVRIVRTRLEEVDAEVVEPMVEGPLSAVDDADFARFEVEPPTTDLLRGIESEDALLDLVSHFPPPRGNALLSLATDPDGVARAEREYRAAMDAEAEAPTLAAALRDDVNSADFWIPDPHDQATLRALRDGFAAWRVFLHPTQRQVVRVDAKGAVKVTGGPGTGKTVVALHRARHVAESLPDDAKVLVTTFSAALTGQLREQLDQLCGDGPTRGRLTARSLVAVARDVLASAGRPNALVTDVTEAWRRALAHDAAGRGRAFYESEREHVVAAADVWDEARYLRVRRTGRGTPLDRRERREIWKVLEAFESALREEGGDAIALARDAAMAIREGETTSPYAAVVCDEVQDVGASELRFLVALASDPETGELRRNGLTLCGDGYQRIYRVPVTLRACGIDVRGRASRVLRLNYRTTEAIRRAAVATVTGLDAGELEDEGVDPLRGYRSLRRGEPPVEKRFDSPEAEADWLASIADGDPMLVLARTRTWLKRLRDLLRARGHEPRLLESGRPDPAEPLVLCSLHRAKGLEAPRVVIAGRQLVPARYPGGGDPEDRALWDRKERCLLYVGLTRARDWCAVSTVGA
ncbi:MAG: UvrD-helicase domain-containing protein [Myxococcota bacterium]|nr:UvrD-helicase domain-containing protein [Myxococcota bacterium]